jgi:hypothetical protein
VGVPYIERARSDQAEVGLLTNALVGRVAPGLGGWNNGQVEMRCAECGCLVDARRVVERCSDPDCCCKDLPDKP